MNDIHTSSNTIAFQFCDMAYCLLWIHLAPKIWNIWFKQDMGHFMGFPGGASGKEPAFQCRRQEFDPWDRKIPWRGGYSNSLQYSCLENPLDRGALWARVHRVAKSWTQLKQVSMHACTHPSYILRFSSYALMSRLGHIT